MTPGWILAALVAFPLTIVGLYVWAFVSTRRKRLMSTYTYRLPPSEPRQRARPPVGDLNLPPGPEGHLQVAEALSVVTGKYLEHCEREVADGRAQSYGLPWRLD